MQMRVLPGPINNNSNTYSSRIDAHAYVKKKKLHFLIIMRVINFEVQLI